MLKLKASPGSVDGVPMMRMHGRSAVAGIGPKLYTYTAFVEPDILINRTKFVRQVETILADPRGWTRGNKVSFVRAPRWGYTQLVLATPDTVDRLCYPLDTEGKVSCCQGTKVVVNIDRWNTAVPHWTGSLWDYRCMLINHEFGHRIGQNHRTCSKPGSLAPVMQQQTYGLQGCRANAWPLDYEL